MSRSSRCYRGGVVTALSLLMVPAVIFRAWPAVRGRSLARPAVASAPQNGFADSYDAGRDPEKDLAAAGVEAKKSGKNIFVEVGGEWCRWCHILDRFFQEHLSLGGASRQKLRIHESEHEPGKSQPRVFVSLSRHPWVSAYLHSGRRGESDSLSTDQCARGRPKLQRKALPGVPGAVRPETPCLGSGSACSGPWSSLSLV